MLAAPSILILLDYCSEVDFAWSPKPCLINAKCSISSFQGIIERKAQLVTRGYSESVDTDICFIHSVINKQVSSISSPRCMVISYTCRCSGCFCSPLRSRCRQCSYLKGVWFWNCAARRNWST